MYATRPISVFKSYPQAAFQPPPAGPNSGYLVLADADAERDPEPSCCWGLCEDTRVRDLPFPQDRILTIRYNEHRGETTRFHCVPVLFIPVLDQSLQSNRYYVIFAKGRNKGKAYTCSSEKDMSTLCFCQCINDVKPRVFDHRDIYQQVEIVPKRGRFTARAVAADGFPPSLLRKKYWRVYASKPTHYSLGEAAGLDTSLRARLSDLDLLTSASGTRKPAVVGRWYCPFMFVKEAGGKLKDQMKSSTFYEWTLERYWEEIFACENLYGDKTKVVRVVAGVLSESFSVNGKEAGRDKAQSVDDGEIWFRPVGSEGEGLGLSLALWERMRWEQARGGWVGGEEKVERVEEYGGGDGWRKFGCYVLVERFVVKRMDGTLAFTFEFRYTNKTATRWE